MPFFDRPPVHDFPDRVFRDALEQVANLRDILVEAVSETVEEMVLLAEQLEPVAGQDKMRWRDLLWLMLSWVFQRRPDEEREGLTRTLVDKQHELALREEVQTVSEATKQTWAQKYVAEAEARVAARSLREGLIEALSDAFGKLAEPLLRSIQTCEDVDRLKGAIKQLHKVTSLDQFQF
jgi:hypothetical protein